MGEGPEAVVKKSMIAVNPDEIQQSEIQYKKLFFDALGVIAARERQNVMPELLMDQESAKKSQNIPFAGSQSILARNDFEELPVASLENAGLSIGGSETSNGYNFVFGFVGDNLESNIISKDTNFTQPIFMVDDKALAAMEKAGISQEQINSFFTGFMKMAGMAEHDYIHTSMMPYMLGEKQWKLFDLTVTPSYPFTNPLERHAASLHCNVVKELFEQTPKRKEAVLKWAANDVNSIAAIQGAMLAAAGDKPAREEAKKIGTYLTEIYCHRLFRVIPPNDPVLDEPVLDGKSVKELMEGIEILVHDQTKIAEQQKAWEEGILAEEKTLPIEPETHKATAMFDSQYNPTVEGYSDIHTDKRNTLLKIRVALIEKIQKWEEKLGINTGVNWSNALLTTHQKSNAQTFTFITKDAIKKESAPHQDAGREYKKLAQAWDKKNSSVPGDQLHDDAKTKIAEARDSLRGIAMSVSEVKATEPITTSEDKVKQIITERETASTEIKKI